jgi:hypothetical protein
LPFWVFIIIGVVGLFLLFAIVFLFIKFRKPNNTQENGIVLQIALLLLLTILKDVDSGNELQEQHRRSQEYGAIPSNVSSNNNYDIVPDANNQTAYGESSFSALK